MSKYCEGDVFTRLYIEELRTMEVVTTTVDPTKVQSMEGYVKRGKVTLSHEVGDQVNDATDDSTALYAYVGVVKIERRMGSPVVEYYIHHGKAVKEFRKAVKNLIKESLE